MTILTLSQHKRMKIADELYRDKRRLCCDRVWQGYNTSQLRQVFLCCDKVFNIGPAQGRISIATRKLCRDIKFRVHNKGLQDFVVTKNFSVVTNKT